MGVIRAARIVGYTPKVIPMKIKKRTNSAIRTAKGTITLQIRFHIPEQDGTISTSTRQKRTIR